MPTPRAIRLFRVKPPLPLDVAVEEAIGPGEDIGLVDRSVVDGRVNDVCRPMDDEFATARVLVVGSRDDAVVASAGAEVFADDVPDARDAFAVVVAALVVGVVVLVLALTPGRSCKHLQIATSLNIRPTSNVLARISRKAAFSVTGTARVPLRRITIGHGVSTGQHSKEYYPKSRHPRDNRHAFCGQHCGARNIMLRVMRNETGPPLIQPRGLQHAPFLLHIR